MILEFLNGRVIDRFVIMVFKNKDKFNDLVGNKTSHDNFFKCLLMFD